MKRRFLCAIVTFCFFGVLARERISIDDILERTDQISEKSFLLETIALQNIDSKASDVMLATANWLIDQGEEPSEHLLRCVAGVSEEPCLVKGCDVYHALPELVSFASRSSDRQERIENNAVIGGDVTQDFESIFALLCRLQGALDDCCPILEEDFRETWTILADIKDTVTECCADLKQTITQDFADTWTILASINDTVTNCCAVLEEDFRETWTILADIKNTVTGCCVDLKQTITQDFADTWTILADIKETVTECCADLKQTITQDFADTWTILASINDTVTNCCAVLEEDFRETWTILADIKDTVTECCADLKQTITQDFADTWTILATISTPTIIFSCDATPITSSIIITVSGIYCLDNQIIGSITIDTDDVTVNLNGYSIIGGTNGIVVNSGVSRVNILNGRIASTVNEGILVGEGCQNIVLQDMQIVSCGSLANPYGIYFAGNPLNKNSACSVKNITIEGCLSGIYLENTNTSEVVNCMVLNGTRSGDFYGIRVAGVVGNTVSGNSIVGCKVANCSATGSNNVFGISFGFCESPRCIDVSVSTLRASSGVFGISFASSPNATVSSFLVSDLAVTAAAGQVLGVFVSTSSGVVADQGQISGISATVAGVTLNSGISFSGSTRGQLSHIAIENVGSSANTAGSYGIQIDSTSSSCNVFDCKIKNISSASQARGLSDLASTIAVADCDVEFISSGTVIGFALGDVGSSVSNISAVRCRCINGAGSIEAIGFGVLATNGIIDQCQAINLSAPPELVGGKGFKLFSGSSLICLNSCMADVITGLGAGIDIFGNDILVQNCICKGYDDSGIFIRPIANRTVVVNSTVVGTPASSIGILNAGVASAIGGSFASKNTINYSGVANTLAIGAASIAGGNISA